MAAESSGSGGKIGEQRDVISLIPFLLIELPVVLVDRILMFHFVKNQYLLPHVEDLPLGCYYTIKKVVESFYVLSCLFLIRILPNHWHVH